MLRQTLLSFLCLTLFNGRSSAQTLLPYKDPALPANVRVKDLLGRMTVPEKLGQLVVLPGWEMYEKIDGVRPSEKFKKAIQEGHTGMFWATLRADPWTRKTVETGLNPEASARATNMLQKWNLEHSRLQIPLFFAEECPHGHMAIGTTVFPTAIGQASTWNPVLIQQMSAVIAREARAQGAHIGYGPVLDLARDPRWSRVEETYGEDPFLVSKMGVAMVGGFQGARTPAGSGLLSTLKHFTAYGVPEGGHNGGAVQTGARSLLQTFLPPFRAAVEAGAGSVMTAYNSIDGVPCSANPYLLKEILRATWDFKGFTVSDLNSIAGLRNVDRVAANYADAAALAMNAGLDADLGGVVYSEPLNEAIASRKVSMDRLDEAVSRILLKKFEMGLFEKPFVDPLGAKGVRNEEAIALARQVARQSVILLKNAGNLLPLHKTLKRIAVIGPNADNMYNQLGDYTAPQRRDQIVTVADGIRRKLPGAMIDHVKGTAIRDTSVNDIEDAVAAARLAEVAVVVLGGSSARDFRTSYQETGAALVSAAAVSDMESGEGFDRETLDLTGHQLRLLRAVASTGTPVVLVMVQGRPLNLNWADTHMPAILNAWYPGQEGGNAIADVLFGDYNPAGRLPVSYPRSVGQLPVFYSYANATRHDYVEGSATPLYPFGYGLSYSRFTYSDLQIQKQESPNRLHVRVSFTVQNTGSHDGEEVAQLYIQDLVSSVVTPNKLLKGFERVFLKIGERKTLHIDLDARHFSLIDTALREKAEKGQFKVLVGPSSADHPLQTMLELQYDHSITSPAN